MNKAALVLLAGTLSLPARADDALGTLTVKGRTTILKAVAATEETGEGGKWLVILASDRKVEGDRSVARLTKLAKDGQLHAVRILWLVGSDTVRAVPYDARLPESGRMGLERPTLDLREFGSGRVNAEFQSKMMGQEWHFHAKVRAAVVPGGTLELEPEAEGFGATAPGGDRKLALGKLGFAYNEESFGHAISDANLDAVRLFLEIGMSPNAHAKRGIHPMLLASMGCGNQGAGKPRSEVLEALVLARGDVKAKDDNGSTALLWAVQGGCSASSVKALLKAGSDPNVRAKGGATPLMYAEIFKRTDLEEILKKAGAKK
ncbi:MAG: ankyrin repeat domain-containing protein [Thermoanaerobaculia bacterium]|nr:ankyrin repeat domain-containing protein [Thermoanaerobaculia bacterium]